MCTYCLHMRLKLKVVILEGGVDGFRGHLPEGSNPSRVDNSMFTSSDGNTRFIIPKLL